MKCTGNVHPMQEFLARTGLLRATHLTILPEALISNEPITITVSGEDDLADRKEIE
jgi:uncharacterized protein (UPF0218 family)